METKVRIGSKDYLAISAPQIDRSLMRSPLSVGNCTAATLSVSILTDDVIPKASAVKVLGRITNDTAYSEWLQFGTFFIDQRDTSFEGLITISCYDAMLKTNQKYATSNSGWPKSMKAVVEDIAFKLGVGIDPRTKINTGADYMIPYPEEKTMADILGSIGACHGGNWIVTEENLLRLVPLITAPDETYHVVSDDYESIVTSDGDTIVYDEQSELNAELPPISGVHPVSTIPISRYIIDEYDNNITATDDDRLIWATDEGAKATLGLINVPVVCGQIEVGTRTVITGVLIKNDDGSTYSAGDATGAILTIEGNPYASQNICDDLFTAFRGLVYLPYTATKTLYDPAAELGDQVKIGSMVHSVICSTRLNFGLNFRSDLSAPNSEELSEEYPFQSALIKLQNEINRLNYAVSQDLAVLKKRLDTLEKVH